MLLHILTASHIEDVRRITYLQYMIESVVKSIKGSNVSVIHHISISSFDVDVSGKIVRPDAYNYDLRFYKHAEKKRQFEHFLHIINNYPFAKNDIIMFLDDDDLLLHIPSEIHNLISGDIDVIRGYQYVPLRNLVSSDEHEGDADMKRIEGGNIDAILLELPIQMDIWSKEYDFSGYTSKFGHVTSIFGSTIIPHFNRIETISRRDSMVANRAMDALTNLLDITFMKKLDMLKCSDDELPFVFHRLWFVDKEWMKLA